MSTKYVYICDHCGAECTDKFEFSLFGKWRRKEARYIPDNVHGCTREHAILVVVKILGIGVDGSARDLIEEQRVELKNLRYKVQKLENANDVNLAHIAAFESRRNVIADELLESLQRVRRRALDFARPHGMDECAVVDVDTITNTIDAELASLTGPKKPTKPATGPKYARADLETKTDNELFELYMAEIGFFDMNGTMVERANMIETLASISADKEVS